MIEVVVVGVYVVIFGGLIWAGILDAQRREDE